MSKQEIMQRVADQLWRESCREAGVQESEIAGITVRLNEDARRWEVAVRTVDGRSRTIPFATAVARHLARPLKPNGGEASQRIPVELQRQARIEPALRYLGVFGFGIAAQDERRLREWLYGTGEESEAQGDFDAYYPGEIQRCAGVIGAILCSENDQAGFSERWADFRGEKFRPDDAAEYGRKWHRLSSWNTQQVAFEEHLSTACIASDEWLTFRALKKQWHGLKSGLVGPAATYSPDGGSEGTQLQIRPVPACQCPTCARWELVKLDNTCSGTVYGHVPHICGYKPKPAGKPGQNDDRVLRIIAKDRWFPVQTWKCRRCERLFFLPDGELYRQRAAAILKVLDGQCAANAAAADSGTVTKKEITTYIAQFRQLTRDEQDRLREQLESRSRAVAYPCPHCGATSGWSPGATFWIPASESPPREIVDKYAGFERTAEQFGDGAADGIDRFDRSTQSDAAPDQVLQRDRLREAARRLAERVQPGTPEYLFVQIHYLDDPPLSVQREFKALAPGERRQALVRLQDLMHQIEIQLEEVGWEMEWSDEKPSE